MSAQPTEARTTAEEIKAVAEQLVAAFNAGEAATIAGMFIDGGEWIDEEGRMYRGQREIEEILKKYFETYPGAKIALEISSLREIGPLAIEEGKRYTIAGEEADAVVDYVAILTKTDAGWKLASVKDTELPVIPRASDALQPLGWLVGEWINEGPDGKVHITYKWSEDGNFLLGEYVVTSGPDVVVKSSTRIGFDPLNGQIRSWVFDSDGGFGEGQWTQIETGWHVNSTAILPDGRAASATILLNPESHDRFTLKGQSRLIGGVQDADFELNIVRSGPAAGTE
ncbi:YybH family protein [Planctomicrobium sp. SH668]|uniref:YybH family protein n=1 Tax=Planctomicrobium sp. SH668 TaxID=3448126 RepID=UPI003F5BA12F